MEESTTKAVTEGLRARSVMAHVASTGLYRFGVRVVIPDGREALWDADGTIGIEAQILRDGVLTGFIPKLEGSDDWGADEIIEAIAAVRYDDPALNARGSVGQPERPPVGQRGGLQETRPRGGVKPVTGGTLNRWRRRLGR